MFAVINEVMDKEGIKTAMVWVRAMLCTRTTTALIVTAALHTSPVQAGFSPDLPYSLQLS